MKKHFIARVVVGHRITIPKEVCQVLEIEEGDLVDVDVTKILHGSKDQSKKGGE